MKPKTKWVTQNLYGRKRKMEYTQCWHVAERFRLETTVVTQRTAGLDMIIVIHVDDVAKNEKVSKFKNISENTNIFSILFYFWNARDILQFAFAIPNNFLCCWTCFFLPKLRLKAIFNDSIVYTWKEAKRCVTVDRCEKVASLIATHVWQVVCRSCCLDKYKRTVQTTIPSLSTWIN